MTFHQMLFNGKKRCKDVTSHITKIKNFFLKKFILSFVNGDFAFPYNQNPREGSSLSRIFLYSLVYRPLFIKRAYDVIILKK